MLQAIVTLFFPPPTSKLEALRNEYMEALLQENQALCAACAEQRVAVASAYGLPAETAELPEMERPSPKFEASMASTERKTGVRLVKLFAA